MKKMMMILVGACMAMGSMAQRVDDDRMKRDIEVAENVLSTLIKQEISKQQNGFFGMEIKGSYLPGYGVTFRIPTDHLMPYMNMITIGDNAVILNKENNGNGYSYTITTDDDDEGEDENDDDDDTELRLKRASARDRGRRVNGDSLREVYHNKMIKAAKEFIVDYGDFLSQLAPNEKIVVTNQGEQNHGWYGRVNKRRHLSVEGLKSDVSAFKQNKLTRDQALGKLNVVNTESVDTKEPELELLSSIIGRLYRPDLSKTFFTEENIYYERLKDYGAMYYMKVYSSNQGDYNRFSMPTLNLDDVDQETRNKKVIELYPKFEQEFKENLLEYGRTTKSLGDDEMLVFNITLTKCKGCKIPSSIEVAVKNNVLKDYAAGKIEKSAALSKFTVKKGPDQ